MKTCKHCAMEIPDKATICPHCRKRVKGISTFAGILIIIFILYVGSKAIDLDRSTRTGGSQPSPNPTTIPSALTDETADETLSNAGKKIKAKHPGWKNSDCNTVAEHKVHVGMTKEQARVSWGKPYEINETNYGTHIHEQWVMHEMGSSYLYFEDGILTTIQTSK